jgi:hypothetical protein
MMAQNGMQWYPYQQQQQMMGQNNMQWYPYQQQQQQQYQMMMGQNNPLLGQMAIEGSQAANNNGTAASHDGVVSPYVNEPKKGERLWDPAIYHVFESPSGSDELDASIDPDLIDPNFNEDVTVPRKDSPALGPPEKLSTKIQVDSGYEEDAPISMMRDSEMNCVALPENQPHGYPLKAQNYFFPNNINEVSGLKEFMFNYGPVDAPYIKLPKVSTLPGGQRQMENFGNGLGKPSLSTDSVLSKMGIRARPTGQGILPRRSGQVKTSGQQISADQKIPKKWESQYIKSYLTGEKREKTKPVHNEMNFNNPRAKKRSNKKKKHKPRSKANIITLDGNIGFLGAQKLKPKAKPFLPERYDPKPRGPNEYQQLIKDYMITNNNRLGAGQSGPSSFRNFPAQISKNSKHSKNGSNKLLEVSDLDSGSHLSEDPTLKANQKVNNNYQENPDGLLAKRSFECLNTVLEKGMDLTFLADQDPHRMR